MRAYTALVVLLAACSGEDMEAPVQDVVAEEPSEAAPAQPSNGKPLCPGEDEPQPGECQRLEYGDRGYCNRWIDCASLH